MLSSYFVLFLEICTRPYLRTFIIARWKLDTHRTIHLVYSLSFSIAMRLNTSMENLRIQKCIERKQYANILFIPNYYLNIHLTRILCNYVNFFNLLFIPNYYLNIHLTRILCNYKLKKFSMEIPYFLINIGTDTKSRKYFRSSGCVLRHTTARAYIL